MLFEVYSEPADLTKRQICIFPELMAISFVCGGEKKVMFLEYFCALLNNYYCQGFAAGFL